MLKGLPLRAFTKTLRFRLMLWNAGIVLITALLVLYGLREGVRRALIHELDLILLEDLREVQLGLTAFTSSSNRIDSQLYEELNRKAAGHDAHRWFVQFFNTRGDVLWHSVNSPNPIIPLGSNDRVSFNVRNYRLIREELTHGIGGVHSVQIGASTNLIEADIRRLDRVVWIAIAIVLVSAPLCGYWLAGRALRPVTDIIDSAVRLRPDQLNERLPNRGTDDELDKIATTVNGLLDRIALYLQDRRDFLANSAHELRSPLAAVRSTVEVALQSGRLSSTDEETLSIVIDQCHSLEHLVNQLLTLAESEVSASSTQLPPIRFDELVTKAVEMFSAAAELKGVEICLEKLSPIFVNGERNLLRQVVNNLLDNAVKFTPDNGRIDVILHADSHGEALLTVRDNGMGIDASDLPHVFNRFFRADRARSRGSRGTGLGLSICHSVVQSHHGSIRVESVGGCGTTVLVRLPLTTVDKNALPNSNGTTETNT